MAVRENLLDVLQTWCNKLYHTFITKNYFEAILVLWISINVLGRK